MKFPRILAAPLVLAAALLSSACRTFGPFPVNATPQNLRIPAGQKLPINTALVIPSPMNFQMTFDLQNVKKDGGKTRDILGTWAYAEPVYPVSRELSKCALDNFQQTFANVTLLSYIPYPTAYGLTVSVRITQTQVSQILYPSSTKVKLTVILNWQVSVLNKQTVEIFSDHGVAQSPEEDASGLSEKFDDKQIGKLTADALSLLTKDIALKVFLAPQVRALVGKAR